MEHQKRKFVYKGLAITFGIMFFSLFFAQVIYEKKVSQLDSDVAHLKNEINEEKLFLAFSDHFSSDLNVCKVIESYMGGLSNKVYQTGSYIERLYKDDKNIEQLKYTQKEWVYLNIELWLRLLKYNKICKRKINYILYFYPYQCMRCTPFSLTLKQLNKKYGESLWLFSIPAEIDIKMVNMIMKYFGIKEKPAVVVNGHVFEGYKSIDKIEKYLISYDSTKKSIKKSTMTQK